MAGNAGMAGRRAALAGGLAVATVQAALAQGSTPPGSTSQGSTSPGSTSQGSTSPGSAPPGSPSPGAAAPGGPAGYAPPMAGRVPLVLPRTEFVYEAVCDLAPTMPLGDSPLGERRIVPITGGSFEGPRIRGTVLAGGADRQLVRKDGVRRLDALYELRTEDGAVITVRNQVLVDDPQGGVAGGGRYAFSTLEITAPEGPHAWLNRGVYVGTLDSLRPERAAVCIRVYKVV